MTPADVRGLIQADYERLESYKAVAEEWNLSSAMAWRVLNQDYWPADEEIQASLTAQANSRNAIERALAPVDELIERVRAHDQPSIQYLAGLERAAELIRGERL